MDITEILYQLNHNQPSLASRFTYIVTQFKDIDAFEDLKSVIGNEISGVFLARLKEFNVPDDRLRQVAEDICYDISSAMNTVGDFEIPSADQLCATREEKTDEIDLPGPGTNELPFLEERTDEIDLPEPGTNDLAFLEEKTDEIDLPEPGTHELAFMEETAVINEVADVQLPHPVKGVMSQEEVVKLLNAARGSFV